MKIGFDYQTFRKFIGQVGVVNIAAGVGQGFIVGGSQAALFGLCTFGFVLRLRANISFGETQ